MSQVIELLWKPWQDTRGASSASNRLRAGLYDMKAPHWTPREESILRITWRIYYLVPALRAVTLTLSLEVPNSEISHP